MTPQVILLFVDETYLANDSGIIRAALPVFIRPYQKVIVPECEKFLKQLGPETKEFKGGHIKRGNLTAYHKFLTAFRNVAALVASNSPLRAVITLDGPVLETGEPFVSVEKHILLLLARVGIRNVAWKNPVVSNGLYVALLSSENQSVRRTVCLVR